MGHPRLRDGSILPVDDRALGARATLMEALSTMVGNGSPTTEETTPRNAQPG